jgi:hypothetical protein
MPFLRFAILERVNFRFPPMRPALEEEPHNLQETRRANIDALGRDFEEIDLTA